VIDRFGKGIRTSPRDALVSESADAGRMGLAFGLHKALDMAGAAIGILITFFLVSRVFGESDYRALFMLSLIPATVGLCLFLPIREKRAPRPKIERVAFWRNLSGLDARLKLYLLVVALFTLGNSSNVFLLLRAQALGFDAAAVILLYFVYHAVASLLSLPCGRLSDKVGRKRLLVAGYLVFTVVYFGFAVGLSQPFLVGMFILYGLHTALVTGVERAFVAEIAPPEQKGTMLGLQSTIAGIALLPASLITGLLWTLFGAAIPFVFGALLSLAATLLLLIFMRDEPGAGQH
jgi:MFS family permease